MSAAGTAKVDHAASAEKPGRFADIDCWVFDLDNTLYPAHCDLWPRIDMRITYYMCGLSGLDGISSRALQKYYYQQWHRNLQSNYFL